jgi:type IV pilus assembly protein PilN
MAHINLLPWREAHRQEKQKEFLSILGLTAIAGVTVVFASHMFVSNMISNQEDRNNYLESKIKSVDKRIEEIKELEKTKQALLDRMEIIQQLQRSRPEIIHTFDELVTTLPDEAYITTLTQRGSQLEIKGKAASNARVSEYMRNLDASPWLASPKLTVIETKKEAGKKRKDNLRSFALNVSKVTPENTADKKGTKNGS